METLVREFANKWQRIILHSYFTRYSLVCHQIDSYNRFIEDMIPLIISENNTIEETQHNKMHKITFTNPIIRKPGIYKNDQEWVEITPRECRLCGLTYSFSLLCTIQHTIINLQNQESHQFIYHDVRICDIPCMLQSRACHYADHYDPVATKENLQEQGGYFIINGNAKTILGQMTLRNNTFHIWATPNNQRYSYHCEMRSLYEKKMRSTSTMYLYITRVKKDKIPKIIINMSSFLNKTLSVCTIFRLLDIEPQTMIQMIMQHIPPTIKDFEFLLISMITNSAMLAKSKEDLYSYMYDNTSNDSQDKQIRNIENICHNEILPHQSLDKTSAWQKAKLLAVGVAKLFLTFIGAHPVSDRDHITNRRLKSSGVMMGELFRKHWRIHMKTLSATFHRMISQHHGVRMDAIVTQNGYLTREFNFALATGNWSKQSMTGTLKGVAQLVTKTTPMSALSHLRRINTPLNRESKDAPPRQLHPSTMMLICPVETPEGAPCGIILNLALSAHVRLGYSESCVLPFIESHEQFIPLSTDADHKERNVCMYINGRWIGFCMNHQPMMDFLKTLRTKQDIPFDVSIIYYPHHYPPSIHINTDAGGLLHPVLNVSRLDQLIPICKKYNHLWDELWERLIHVGVIEYIDKEEELQGLVAMRIEDLYNNPQHHYTYLEIAPDLMFGVCGSLIPLSDHNQAPRNMYQASMCKQSIGMQMDTFVDTKSDFLWYPQKPLVTTQLSEYMCDGMLPSGENVVLAIGCYTGFNQEDSIILNRDAIDRGLLRSTRTTTVRESMRKTNTDQTIFCKVDADTDKINTLRYANYNKLDDDGLVYPGDLIQENDVMIGKLLVTNPSSNNNIMSTQQANETTSKPRDQSVVWEYEEPAIIKDVMLSSNIQKENLRIARLHTFSTRIPQIGDKFSSRHGQKGVIGMIYPSVDLPYTYKDGIVPDMIINPHCIPSRMTMAHIIETLLGKLSCMEGQFGDGTPFKFTSVNEICDYLEKHMANGGDKYGNETMISGIDGKMLEQKFFIGVVFYQRLKHQSRDKIHARSKGPKNILTHQPTDGRSRDGGLRFGEMERDAVISHGASYLLQDRMMKQSDSFITVVCTQCGYFSQHGTSNMNIKYNSYNDKSMYYCNACKTSDFVKNIEIPYGLLTFSREISACNIGHRFNLSQDE